MMHNYAEGKLHLTPWLSLFTPHYKEMATDIPPSLVQKYVESTVIVRKRKFWNFKAHTRARAHTHIRDRSLKLSFLECSKDAWRIWSCYFKMGYIKVHYWGEYPWWNWIIYISKCQFSCAPYIYIYIKKPGCNISLTRNDQVNADATQCTPLRHVIHQTIIQIFYTQNRHCFKLPTKNKSTRTRLICASELVSMPLKNFCSYITCI